MSKPYSLALHIFRRDLRWEDNTALQYALEYAEKVIPCFILDKRQVGDSNRYRSLNAVQFMVGCIQDLAEQLAEQNGKLYLFYGQAEEVVNSICEANPVDLITLNRDYTPFARKRDEAIQQIAKKKGIMYYQLGDALLQEPEEVAKPDGKPYTVFTPFFKKSSLLPVRKPKKTLVGNLVNTPIVGEKKLDFLKSLVPHSNDMIFLQGGSKEAHQLLKRATTLSEYAKLRDYPEQQYTSFLSAHHKFGTISIREVYHTILAKLGKEHRMITEIYWRDFFTHIAHHYPHIWEHAFQRKYDDIPWEENPQLFEAWCEGKTGFPIVDAGMRELNTTGYMHNRVRMITASFLVKDLHINWKWGERYFAQKLIDYDPAVNNGNWQWAASTGCDAQPYFRIFNPWRQQLRFDPNATYIKQWLPELRNLPPATIHELYEKQLLKPADYPLPLVNHAIASQKAKALFQTTQ